MEYHETITPIEWHVIKFVVQYRNKNNITQQDIADILQVSREYIRDIENPKRRAKYNMTHVNALADHFNLSPRDFFPAKAFPHRYKSDYK